jgi:hypothetical protein
MKEKDHRASGGGGEGGRTREHEAEDVRQGRIGLRRTWQRVVFFGALAVAVLLALIFGR